MKTSGLLKLIAVTVVVVAAAFLMRDDGSASADGASVRGERWLAGLHDRVNDVARVRVVSGDGHFEVHRTDDGWVIDDWGGYPAKFDAVVGTVMGLSELKLDGPMTARPENHAALQLEDPSGPGAASLGLTFEDAAGTVLADVVVGKTKGAASLFVRRAGEDQTWEVDGKLSPPKQPVGWVDKELLRLPAADMLAVIVTAPDAEPVRMVKPERGSWALDPLPAGRELSSSAPFSALAGAVAYLDLESVAGADEAAAERDWITTTFETKDGLLVHVASAESDGKAYARLSFEAGKLPAAAVPEVNDAGAGIDDAAAGIDDAGAGIDDAAAGIDDAAAGIDDAAANDADVTAETAATADTAAVAAAEAAAEAAAAEALRQRVDELTARHARWTYVLPSWKATALRKRVEDFLEPLPEVGPALPEADALDGDPAAPAAPAAPATEPLAPAVAPGTSDASSATPVAEPPDAPAAEPPEPAVDDGSNG